MKLFEQPSRRFKVFRLRLTITVLAVVGAGLLLWFVAPSFREATDDWFWAGCIWSVIGLGAFWVGASCRW